MKLEQTLWASLLSASTAFANPTGAKPSDFKSKCSAIASKLAIDNGKVYFSEYVAAGTNLSLHNIIDSRPRRHLSCCPFRSDVEAVEL
jgi:feruloyl esterase